MHPGIANFKQLLSEKLAKLYDVCFQSHEHFDYSVWDIYILHNTYMYTYIHICIHITYVYIYNSSMY